MKKIAILGSTGSIGTQTLAVVRANGENAGRTGKRISSSADCSVG